MSIATVLRRAGCHREQQERHTGYYAIKPDSIDIFPGVESYFRQEPAAIHFAKNRIDRIVSLRDNTERPRYDLEPQAASANLHDRNREKQRLVPYDDNSACFLRDAILSAEDKRFFTHPGFDIIGIPSRHTGRVDLENGFSNGASRSHHAGWRAGDKFYSTISKTWKPRKDSRNSP